MNNSVILAPAASIQQIQQLMQHLLDLRQNVLQEGVDYGVIPGSKKPSLLLPGAQKLSYYYSLTPHYVELEKFVDLDKENGYQNPFMMYRYECQLIDSDGRIVGSGIGSANTRETKFFWRWVSKEQLPKGFNADELETKSSVKSEFKFAIDKAETTGKYGKPAEYWKEFQDAIYQGTARITTRKTSTGKEMEAVEIGAMLYRVPNRETFDMVNTIDKMAQKRAYVAATLTATAASAYFTQDIEDLPDFRDSIIIEGEVVETKEAEKVEQKGPSLEEQKQELVNYFVQHETLSAYYTDRKVVGEAFKALGITLEEGKKNFQQVTFEDAKAALDNYGTSKLALRDLSKIAEIGEESVGQVAE